MKYCLVGTTPNNSVSLWLVNPPLAFTSVTPPSGIVNRKSLTASCCSVTI